MLKNKGIQNLKIITVISKGKTVGLLTKPPKKKRSSGDALVIKVFTVYQCTTSVHNVRRFDFLLQVLWNYHLLCL